MSKTTCAAAALCAASLCLSFTPGPAWADHAHSRDRWVDDPFQDHDTTGAEARAGSMVGILVFDDVEYTGLGGMVAAGHRWGGLTIDAEYGYLEVTARGPSSVRFGSVHQLGVNIRYDVLSFGSRWVGPNSMAALFLEAHTGRQFRRGDPVLPTETVRARMSSGQVTLLGAGIGVLFDHRIEQPRGFPNRIGWQLGWRVLTSPRTQPDGYAVCRGGDCTAAPAPETSMELDATSLVLSSSLAFTW